MRADPPAQLVATLERLGLATASDLAGVAVRVQRLARHLPPFDSIWIDALAQARVLTPYQAAELHAGRGEALRVGPYLLCQPLDSSANAAAYRARHQESRLPVRLVVLPAGPDAEGTLARLEQLVSVGQRWRLAHAMPARDAAAVVEAAGLAEGRLWAASSWIEGRSVADQLTRCGRFPPGVVLEIARPLIDLLADLEQIGLPHGRLTRDDVLLTRQGGVMVVAPGLHAALGLRPAADGPDCGRLLWQMLCGRSEPRAMPDCRQFAPLTPKILADVVAELLSPELGRELAPLAALSQRLGRSTDETRRTITRFLAQQRRPSDNWFASFSVPRAPLIDLGPWLAPAGWTALATTLLLAGWLGYRHWPASPAMAPALAQATTASAPAAASGPVAVVLPAVEKPRAEPPSHNQQVNRVEPASYVAPTPTPAAPQRLLDLVLDPAQSIDAASLQFRAGQRVRGLSGKRPVLVVPAGGLIVDAEDVCFENIDFVVEGQTTALVELRAASAEFCGCTFRSGTEAAALSALAWRVPVGDNAGASLPTGQLVLVDCIFEGVGTAIVCHAGAARAIELSNVLHRGRGPLVRLTAAPRQDESIRLTLAHVTLRESGPLVESACHEGAAAGIAIVAESCALAPREGEPLVRFRGPDGADRLLANLTWSGQDSLLAAATPFALWSQGDEEPQRLDEQSISVAGLVRSEIGFAAPASRDPAASRATRWLAPLSSTEPPGIEPKRLPRSKGE